MTLRSGLAIQAGYAPETTPGTIVTPTTFLPVTDLPSVAVAGDAAESEGIIAGRTVLTSDQWNGGNLTVGGDVPHELYDHGMDRLFRAMFGSMSQSGADPYTHTHTPGALDDDAMTVQYGIPSTGGSVIPATFSGCQVASWEIACQQGAIATLGLTFAGMHGHLGSRSVSDGATTDASATVTSTSAAFSTADVGKPISGTGIPAGAQIVSVESATSCTISAAATATGSSLAVVIGTPLATASYPSSLKPIKSLYTTVTIGGVATEVQNVTIAGDNGLAIDRYKAGSPWPKQPVESDLRSYTGTIDQEFASTAMWDRFRAGAEATVKATMKRGSNAIVIEGNARFDANAPTGNGRGIVSQSIPIKFIASGASDSTAIKLTTVNSDNVT